VVNNDNNANPYLSPETGEGMANHLEVGSQLELEHLMRPAIIYYTCKHLLEMQVM
jgi:hypothetical protein